MGRDGSITYAEFGEWLEKVIAEGPQEAKGPATNQQLRHLFLRTAVPYIGFGMCLHGTIQSFADSLGLPNPHLTASQRKSAPVQYVNLCAGVFGVVTGCLIGMFPLNFMNSPKSHH